MSNKKCVLLVVGLSLLSPVGLVQAGSGHVWTLDADAEYFGSQRAHLSDDYSVLAASITAAASNAKYSAEVDRQIKEIAGAGKWVLLQEINIEGASFSATLFYLSPGDRMPHLIAFGVKGGEVYRLLPRSLTRRKFLDEFVRELPTHDNLDYSESQILDGTAAYITVYDGGRLKRAAIYEPESVPKDTDPGAKVHRSLARLVAKLKEEAVEAHE